MPEPKYKKSIDGNFIVTESTQFNNWMDEEVMSPWKIHLSIDPKHVQKAYDIVTPILMVNNVLSYKVTNMDKVAEAIKDLEQDQSKVQ